MAPPRPVSSSSSQPWFYLAIALVLVVASFAAHASARLLEGDLQAAAAALQDEDTLVAVPGRSSDAGHVHNVQSAEHTTTLEVNIP